MFVETVHSNLRNCAVTAVFLLKSSYKSAQMLSNFEWGLAAMLSSYRIGGGERACAVQIITPLEVSDPPWSFGPPLKLGALLLPGICNTHECPRTLQTVENFQTSVLSRFKERTRDSRKTLLSTNVFLHCSTFGGKIRKKCMKNAVKRLPVLLIPRKRTFPTVKRP